MAEHTIQNWIKVAVKQMKFPPDRDRVRQELWDHLLDSREARMERGMELKEAEEAAVKAMGDPVETGKLLNKVHRPILSQLWWASRWCLISILCISIGAAVRHEQYHSFNWDGMLPGLCADWEQEGCTYALGQYLETPYTEVPIRPGAVEQAGVYTLTLDHGNWVKTEDRQRLMLGFRVKAEHLLDLSPFGLGARLCAEDDLGNQYHIRWYNTGMGDNGYRELYASTNPWYHSQWREPYVHLMFETDDGVERQWIRFYVPDTEFDITIDSEGRVIP